MIKVGTMSMERQVIVQDGYIDLKNSVANLLLN